MSWYVFYVNTSEGVRRVKAEADRWQQAESNMLAAMLRDGYEVENWTVWELVGSTEVRVTK